MAAKSTRVPTPIIVAIAAPSAAQSTVPAVVREVSAALPVRPVTAIVMATLATVANPHSRQTQRIAVAAVRTVTMRMPRACAVPRLAKWVLATPATAIVTVARRTAAKSRSTRSVVAVHAVTSVVQPTPHQVALRARATRPAAPATAIAMLLPPTAASRTSAPT